MYFNDVPLEGLDFNFATNSIFSIEDATLGVNPPPVSGNMDYLGNADMIYLGGAVLMDYL